jgi:uncharacterized membrane protein YqaE (UPF0057 family)
MNNLALKILAIFFPPIAVLIKYGIGKKFLLNIVLTLIGWIPGVIHAFIVLSQSSRSNQMSTT